MKYSIATIARSETRDVTQQNAMSRTRLVATTDFRLTAHFLTIKLKWLEKRKQRLNMEKQILCTGSVVRAILDGSQSQDRRPIKQCFTQSLVEYGHPDVHTGQWVDAVGKMINAPWQVGDLLYVRETYRLFDAGVECSCYDGCVCYRSHGKPIYRADSEDNESKWKPSIHMPKRLARIWLEVLSVRAEKIQDISQTDSEAEGMVVGIRPFATKGSPKEQFQTLWDSLYKKAGNGWDTNCWVWRTEFKQTRKG